MNTLVSICIPTFNGEMYIAEAMDSAIQQTYKNLEIIISDDESTDNTLKIIETYKSKTNIPIYIFNQKQKGIGANWNNSIKKSNGEYIKFLFQDDVLNSTCIEEMLVALEANPKLGMVTCKRGTIIEGEMNDAIKRWIDKYGNLQRQFDKQEPIYLIDKSLFSKEYFFSVPFNKIGEPSTVMFRKEIIHEVGCFDENLKQILDYVFYYRVLKRYPIAIINKPLVQFRIHEKQATNVNRNKPIADYEIYKRILFKEFLELLHPTYKKKLALEFSYVGRLKLKLKDVLKNIRS